MLLRGYRLAPGSILDKQRALLVSSLSSGQLSPCDRAKSLASKTTGMDVSPLPPLPGQRWQDRRILPSSTASNPFNTHAQSDLCDPALVALAAGSGSASMPGRRLGSGQWICILPAAVGHTRVQIHLICAHGRRR